MQRDVAGPGTWVDPAELLALRRLAASVAGLRTPSAAAVRSAPGTLSTRRRGRGLDVDDVRPWTAGDDLRHLDRNATARSGQPHVRRFRDEREQAVLLVADFRPSMLFGTRGAFRSVAAARALALIGWQSSARGCRVGLLAAGLGAPLHLRPVGGERAMPAIVGALAHAHALAAAQAMAADPPLAAAIEAALAVAPRGGLVVLASGFEEPGPGLAEALAALRRRADVRVALVLDAFEQRPPRGFYPFVRRDGFAAWGRIGRTPAADPAAGRRALLERAGVQPMVLDAGAPIEQQAAALRALHAGLV